MPAIQVKCVACGAATTYVVLTRQLEGGVLIRRRRCTSCDFRWYTEQEPEVPISKYKLRWKARGRICKKAS
jgi:transcriptional regulator NrdR family protein